MTDFPVKIPTRATAIETAREISKKEKRIVYLYAVTEGGYRIDCVDLKFSNEKLLFTFKNGMPI
jgi:hypothetical protein